MALGDQRCTAELGLGNFSSHILQLGLQLVPLSDGMVTSIQSTQNASTVPAESHFEQGVWLAYTTPLRGFWGWLLGSIPAYHLAVLINGFVYEISVPGMRFIGLSGSGSVAACSKGSRRGGETLSCPWVMTWCAWMDERVGRWGGCINMRLVMEMINDGNLVIDDDTSQTCAG